MEEAAVVAVAPPAPEAVEALPEVAQAPIASADHIKEGSAANKDDCKIEYVLVEDKSAAVAADEQVIVAIEPELNPPAARFESRLNSRGKIKEHYRRV